MATTTITPGTILPVPVIKTAKPLTDWTAVQYLSVDGSNSNSFRRPRQKMWGVFCRIDDLLHWTLVDITNDFRYGKLKVQQFLKVPPAAAVASNSAGINSVILCEIVPADTFVTV